MCDFWKYSLSCLLFSLGILTHTHSNSVAFSTTRCETVLGFIVFSSLAEEWRRMQIWSSILWLFEKKKVLPIPSILQVYIKGSLRDRWPGHTSTPAKAMLVPHTHMHAWFGGVCVKAHHKHSRHLISFDDNSGLWYFVDFLQSHSVNFAHPGITFSYCPSINSLIGCYLSQYFE